MSTYLRCASLAFGCVLWVAPVVAQDGRAELQQGVEAARASRWEEARQLFLRAYELSDRAAVLINLAGAERNTGRLVEAAATYRRFLDEANGPDAQHIPTAQAALADVERATPRVTIAIASGGSGEVYLDGRSLSSGQLGTEVPLNPGSHRIELRQRGAVVAIRDVDLSEGEQEAIELRPTDIGTSVNPPDSQPTTTSSRRSPWLWVGIGLGVAAAAGAVTAVVLTTGGGSESPYMGNFGEGHFEVP